MAEPRTHFTAFEETERSARRRGHERGRFPIGATTPRSWRWHEWGVTRAAMTMLAALSLLLLAACAGPAGPITVHGTVVNTLLEPMPGLEVYLGTSGTPQTTAADGSFALTAVTPPYDVTVVDPAHDAVLVVRGLTRADPTVQISASSPPSRQAKVAGAISGASVHPGQLAAVLIGSDTFGDGSADIPLGTAFAGTYEWVGDASLPVTLFGIVLDVNASALPSTFAAFGTRAAMLDDGTTATGLDVPMLPITTAHLTGTATGAAGLPLDELLAIYTFRDGTHVATAPPFEWPATPSFDVSLPNVPAASATLVAFGSGSGGEVLRWRSGLRATDSGLNLSMVPPAALSTPVAGAANIAEEGTFRWSATDASVYMLLVTPNAAGPNLTIVTADPQATLPDLSALSLSSSLAGASYRWHVVTLGHYDSVDAAAGPDALLTSGARIEGAGGALVIEDGWAADSHPLDFTFAP